MKINKEELESLSKSLLFTMTDDQYNTLIEEFDVILEQMDIIGSIENIDEVEPMVFPYIVQGHMLREDEPSDMLDKDEVLSNCKDTMMDMIKVKKVVG